MVLTLAIGSSCWWQVIAELDRVYPNEGIAVPLLALSMRSPDFNPCTGIQLADLAEVQIAKVVLVPDGLQLNQAVRVSVLPQTDRLVNRKIEELTHRYPLLRACAALHSHPFARGATWPSGGCGDYRGHMLPLLERNRQAGLFTCFSFIACRTDFGPGWRLQGFALDAACEVVDLGFVRVLPDDCLTRALLPGLEQRPPVRRMLRRWRYELRRSGLPFKTDELFGGWLRTIIEVDERRRAVILLPIDFPSRSPQCFWVAEDGKARRIASKPMISLRPDAWITVLEQMRRCGDGPA